MSLDEIILIDEESFSSHWNLDDYKKLLEFNNAFIIEEKKHDNLYGFALLIGMVDVLEIIRIAVKKEYRRQGVAKMIMNLSFEKAKKMNYNKIMLEVRENNTPAIELYKDFGFEEISIRKKYYSDTGENAIVMLKRID